MNVKAFFIDKMDKVVLGIFHTAAVLAAAIVFLVCLGIFSRYLFGHPLNWVPGVVTLFADWAVFLMVGVYMYRNQEVFIPYFFEKLFSSRAQRTVLFLVDLTVLAFTAITAWYIWKAMEMGGYMSSITTLPITYNWFTAPFIIGMLLGGIGAVKRLVWRESVDRRQ